MSNPLAMAAVSAVLQYYFGQMFAGTNLTALLGGAVAVTSRAPDIVQSELALAPALQNQVNLFLHQVTYNQGWRNVGLPSLGADGKTRVQNPPLALDLHYLLTAYGSLDWQAEALLGYALTMLQQNPVLSRSDISNAFLAISGLSPWAAAIAGSGLADQIETIKITPSTLGREEMAWLWTALKADYRPTFPFQVSVVLMETDIELGLAFPVLSRNIHANPIAAAQISQVIPPNKQVSAAAGDEVTVTGEFLAAASLVSLNNGLLGISLTAPVVTATNSSLTFVMPAETVLQPFPSGIYELSAILTAGPAGPIVQTTGSLPIAVAPVIQLAPPPVVLQGGGQTQVTIQFAPNVLPQQRVQLAIGSSSAPPVSLTATTNTLSFVYTPALAAGPQLMRMVVDNSPSVIDVDWKANPPKFVSPMVTI